MRVSLDSVDSKLRKMWPPNRYWGPKGNLHINIEIYMKHVLKSYSETSKAKKCEITMQGLKDSVYSNLIKPWHPD